MGKFLESEKIRQTELKKNAPYFSNEARADGVYNRKARPFCLPLDYAEQNLYSAIREPAMRYFEEHAIHWHNGHDDKPSNHLCDSQVCCVNFLFPLADKPQVLARVLQRFFPQVDHMLPVEDGLYVGFEWIGWENYLGERARSNGRRTRGANFTSADAIVLFERKDGQRQTLLIEWKYTESYGRTSKAFSGSGTDRTQIYRHLYEDPGCPLKHDLIPEFACLFYEPFYQLMRQQFLANEMEKSRELDAQIVSLLHIAPARNLDFRKVTSPKLEGLADSVTGVWKKLVKNDSRFISLSTEQIFGDLKDENSLEVEKWLDYLNNRYSWLKK